MIRFSLVCDHDHDFEAWFRSNDDFDAQKDGGLVTCPMCGSAKVSKALMAPSVSTSRKREQAALQGNIPEMAASETGSSAPLPAAAGPDPAKLMAEMTKLARQLRANSENVGDKFAEEARKIHYGEADPRGIYGKASNEEARDLAEEGVPFIPLPELPEDQN